MNRDEIKEIIVANLKQAGIVEPFEVSVQPDPFEGWRIYIIAQGFEGKTLPERKKIISHSLESINIEWLELMTPAEKEWAGTIPIDSDLADMPMWPEALARSKIGIEAVENIIFPSDLEEDLELPIVATFYSVRGGVGRSTSLAYTAMILASRGRKVLCVDMDLEAPGLASLFGKEAEVKEGFGLVNLLISLDRGENPDISEHLLQVSEEFDLYCLPAGFPDANYARLLNFIDPGAWYREDKNVLRELLTRLGNDLPFSPDVILLDSRTGFTPLSGPLLFDLADLSVIVFYPHPQAKTATAALVQALLHSKTRRILNGKRLTPEPRFLVSPIPASKVPEVVKRYEHRSLEWIDNWLSIIERNQEGEINLIASEITHFVSYKEILATSDQIMVDREVWRDYEPISEWIERFLPSTTEQLITKSLPEQKNDILSELKFSSGTAEDQDDFLLTFVETDIVKKALDPSLPLILGRKGTGKTAVFRRLLENNENRTVVVLAPSGLRRDRGWLLGPDSFQSVEELLKATGANWRHFWSFYTCLACHNEGINQEIDSHIINTTLETLLTNSYLSELDVIKFFESFIKIPRYGLIANEWLLKLDSCTTGNTLLLFDGLDTGFGNSQGDRERRRNAIQGLFEFQIDQADRLRNLKFKIVLREDIWRKLRFENKSHFFGRSVNLKWVDKTNYFKVVIKQALRSKTFKSLLTVGTRIEDFSEPDYWGESEVLNAWNYLVGERMKGGKTAFTRNWVWNRLADGNGDHSPRYLLQLFHVVTEWEKTENRKSSYEKSIIRPRALIQSLPTVSKQALEALGKEEFPELTEIFEKLRDIGRTPVPSDDLRGLDELVSLAREVGLLGVYEGSAEKVERYMVPEIYRYALGMTRKGQA